MAAPWRGGNVLRQVLAGAAVGAATISAVIGIIVAGGWATLAWSGVGAVTVLSTAVPKLVNTLFEEIIFRGIMLRTLEHWRGSYLALALSALVFGAIHLSNPDGSLAGATASRSAAESYSEPPSWRPVRVAADRTALRLEPLPGSYLGGNQLGAASRPGAVPLPPG
jgi:membrane protease YdiL (CAAX protease family)